MDDEHDVGLYVFPWPEDEDIRGMLADIALTLDAVHNDGLVDVLLSSNEIPNINDMDFWVFGSFRDSARRFAVQMVPGKWPQELQSMYNTLVIGQARETSDEDTFFRFPLLFLAEVKAELAANGVTEPINEFTVNPETGKEYRMTLN